MFGIQKGFNYHQRRPFHRNLWGWGGNNWEIFTQVIPLNNGVFFSQVSQKEGLADLIREGMGNTHSS